MTHRLAAFRDKFDELGIDAFLVSAPNSRVYLSGFTGSSGYLLITRSDAVVVTDFRYVEQAESESSAHGFGVARMLPGVAWLPPLVSRFCVRRMGIEADDLTVSDHRRILESLSESDDASDVVFEETVGVVEGIRAVKDIGEMALLMEAVVIADRALAEVSSTLEVGITERQIARDLEDWMRRLGAEGPSFETIVAAGPNAARPHHRPTDTKIRQGDSVVIDMGANYRGYRSDLTRTFAVGGADGRFEEIYGIVLEAQTAGIVAIRPGMKGAEADEAARDVIARAGYADAFGHGLGHGVGLAIHERPRIVPRSEDTITDGMVFTIEPGIYLTGWGGVRIEDIVVMENGRAKPLTRSPK